MKFKATFHKSEQSFRSDFGEVHNISDGGYERGYAAGEEAGIEQGIAQGIEQGKEIGYADGYNKCTEDMQDDLQTKYDEGKQAEYDRFWDAYQENGERTDYRNAFIGYYWNKETLRPKYTCKVVGTGGSAMFSHCYWRTPVTDPNDLFDISNIPIDVTEATDCGSMFANAKVDNVRLIFGDKITSLNTAFTKGGGGGIAGMHITLLVPNPNCDWTNAFAYHGVKELNLLDGTVIGTNGFNVQWAIGLSKANLISIINALSKDTSGLSATLSKYAVDKAFETSEGANDGSASAEWEALIATKPNCTINLA